TGPTATGRRRRSRPATSRPWPRSYGARANRWSSRKREAATMECDMLNVRVSNANLLSFALLALVAILPPLKTVAGDSAEAAVRAALAQWTQDFNGRNAD